MEIKEEHLLRLLNQSDKGKKPLKWYDKVNICLLFIPVAIYGICLIGRGKQISRAKEKMRCFNPIIRIDFFGNDKIEWIERDKPLTDEELNKLI